MNRSANLPWPAGAKAADRNKGFIAALKRCATQNQVQHRLPQAVERALPKTCANQSVSASCETVPLPKIIYKIELNSLLHFRLDYCGSPLPVTVVTARCSTNRYLAYCRANGSGYRVVRMNCIRAAFVMGAVLLWAVTPALACLLPGVVQTEAERACCHHF